MYLYIYLNVFASTILCLQYCNDKNRTAYNRIEYYSAVVTHVYKKLVGIKNQIGVEDNKIIDNSTFISITH